MASYLNEVHPRGYTSSTSQPHEIYDLIAIGAGAGGLVSAKQSARQGAKSAMISEHLAGGDCLNVGCEPKSCNERLAIAPADGHEGTTQADAHVFQGRWVFTSAQTIRVGDTDLKFRNAVIATGGRPSVPDIPGLAQAPYSTNEVLFNLETLPPRMAVLGVIALKMAQAFASFASQVTVIMRSAPLFASKEGDEEAVNKKYRTKGMRCCRRPRLGTDLCHAAK